MNLCALGRLTEALQPMRAVSERSVQQENWRNAAICASNLSDLEVTLGRLPDAVTDARHAEAEQMQKEWQPQFDLLYSAQGFRYCDWLLAPAEQAAWQHCLDQSISIRKSDLKWPCRGRTPGDNDVGVGHAVELASRNRPRSPDARPSRADPGHLGSRPREFAADARPGPHRRRGLRAAGSMDELPRGLLTALTRAAALIRTHGYGRRTEELADAEKALSQSR